MPQPQPHQPVYYPPAVQGRHAQNYYANPLLTEMAAQYKQLTWMEFIGIFLVPAYLIGLVLIIYGGVQKPAFRRRVIELGYDADAWERPLRKHSYKVLLSGVAMLALLGVWFTLFILSSQRSRGSL